MRIYRCINVEMYRYGNFNRSRITRDVKEHKELRSRITRDVKVHEGMYQCGNVIIPIRTLSFYRRVRIVKCIDVKMYQCGNVPI